MPNLPITLGLAIASALTVLPQDVSTVQRHTVELADDKYEGRGAGYPGERRAADYIAAQFRQIGLAPAGDAGGYFQAFRFHVMHPVKPWEILESRNVIGRIDGTDAALKGEVVVIGAHYDGQGKTGQADPFRVPSPESPADQIWNSANDNAASVAALLEIARAMKQGTTPPKRSVLFVAFGAEEHGMTGSLHYVAHPAAPIRDHAAMINLEKLGRVSDKPFNMSGNATSSVWAELVKTIAPQIGVQVVPTNPFAVPESDHYPFAASGVPAIMFYVTGAPDSHQPSDSAERIDFNRVAQAARTVLHMSLDLASRPQRPSFTPAPFPDVGLSVHLATAAEADAREVAAPQGGLKVTGVIAGLPADKAGLQPGDFIVEMANQQFRRDETLAALMAMHREVLEGKRGFTLPLKVVRGKTRLDLVMNLR
jgi:peptidase M28-like protein/PDZ domain-containing protein